MVEIPSYLSVVNKKAENLPDLKEVSRVDRVNHETIVDFGKRSAPCVFKFNWHIDFLKKLISVCGNAEVQIRTGDYAHPHNYASVEERRYEETTLIAFYKSPTGGYLGNFKLMDEWLADLQVPYPVFVTSKENFYNPSLWMGSEGCITPLHQDGLDNVAYHITGGKRWHLIHPKYHNMLNTLVPFPKDAPNLAVVMHDLRDKHVYAEIKKQVPIQVVEVNEGQALFLPAGWFHFVETTSFSVMINFWVNPQKQLPLILTN